MLVDSLGHFTFTIILSLRAKRYKHEGPKTVQLGLFSPELKLTNFAERTSLVTGHWLTSWLTSPYFFLFTFGFN